MSRNLLNLIVCLLLVAATVLAFSQVVGHDFVNYDDEDYVTENYRVQKGLSPGSVKWAFTTTHAANWHPLTWLSHMLDCDIYGLDAGGHHLTSLVLHVVCTLLLFQVLLMMTGALWRSAFVAALFALHPLHVESVAWVAERKDVLSTLFWLLTMGAWVRYARAPGVSRYLAALILFALGLMAKPMLVSLPFVLLLLDFWPLGRFLSPLVPGPETKDMAPGGPPPFKKSSWKGLLLEKAPLFALSAVSSIITVGAQKGWGAVATLAQAPLKLRAANALVSYAGYIGKMLWPANLAIFYPLPGAVPGYKVLAAALFLAGVSGVAVFFRRRFPYLLVGWLWYLGTLVPVIGLVKVGSHSMADRYTYVPLIGLFIMVAWAAVDLLKERPRARAALPGAALAVLLALAAATWIQVRTWKNGVTLFRHASTVTANNYLAHNNLGMALMESGLTAEALVHLNRALEIKPDYAEPHNNLGVILTNQGRIDDAIAHLKDAVRLDPRGHRPHNNLGYALEAKGRFPEAIRHYEMALERAPEYPKAHYNLGVVLEKTGRVDDAIARYKSALNLDPGYREAHNNLGVIFARKGLLDRAAAHLKQSLSLDPRDAGVLINLGNVMLLKKDFKAAISSYARAIKADPGRADAYNNLGVALMRTRRFDKALKYFSKALEIAPDYMDARRNRGTCLRLIRRSKLNSKRAKER